MRQRALDRLRVERGSALVVAILVTVMLLALGLGTLAFADNQSRQGGNERIQESTFNLTEAALRQQVFLLSSQGWPGSPAFAYPTCTKATAASETRCPNDSEIRASYKENDPDNKDYSAGYSWETRVQDNGPPVADYYTTEGASDQPGWDESGPDAIPDGKVWVRATSTVRGRTRAMVAQAEAERVSISFFPRHVVTAGCFSAGNGNGKGNDKTLVDTQGDQGQSSNVRVRSEDADCVSESGVSPGQVTPGYTGGAAMTEEELNGLRGIARQTGTYFASGCPSDLTGTVVFIESGNCSYEGNSVFNSSAEPGTVVIVEGTLTFKGTVDFFGLIYAANKQESGSDEGPVVSTQGNPCIQGAITVDGGGGVDIGSSGSGCKDKGKGKGKDKDKGGNLLWDPTAIDQLKTLRTTILDGTWRELCVRQTDGTDCPSS